MLRRNQGFGGGPGTQSQQGLGSTAPFTTGLGSGQSMQPQAVRGPSLGAASPPVYGAGSGVAGTPMVLVSTDGGNTWQLETPNMLVAAGASNANLALASNGMISSIAVGAQPRPTPL